MATYPSLGDDIIRLPDDMVSSSTGPEELISKMSGSDPTMLRNVDFMSSKAILGARNVDVDTINGLATDNFLQGLKPLLSAGEVRLWSSFLSNCPAQRGFGCCQQCLVPCHLQLRHYFSADNTEETSKSYLYLMEFLNSLNPSGSPPHDLKLKEDMPVIIVKLLAT